jgi:predicted dehydrogenase
MKYIPFIFIAVMFVIILSAGCVDPAERIIGTWTSDDFPESLGEDYTNIITTFNADGTGTETWVYSNGSTYTWNTSWINDGKEKYAYVYDSWTSTLAEDGKTQTDSDGLVYVREEGDDGEGYVGTWITSQAYYDDASFYTIVKEIRPDNTGSCTWISNDGTVDGPWDLVWGSLNETTCNNYYRDAIIYFTILDNGTGLDSYNLTFIRL